MGCPHNIVNLVSFLTHERNVSFVVSDSYTITRKVFKGLPQGAVLSPLLYLIYVNDITVGLNPSIRISQFADNIAIYYPVTISSKSKRSLEKTITTLGANLDHLGLSLAPKKTIFSHFNQKGIRPGTCSIKIDNCSIRSGNHVQFLGIFFDYQLKFNVHINYVRNKCSKKLNILKFISGIKWGAELSTLISLYKSLIRSYTDYSFFAYAPKTKNLMLKMERIQYAALKIALRYRNSTPTNIILGESRLCMPQHRTKYLCNRFIMKNLSNSGSTLYNWVNRQLYNVE